MIVVISDLHLQHTAHDVIRRRDAGGVVEYGVRRNVGEGALHLLFSEIADNARRTFTERVELVLGGDIFELHRSPAWFFGGSLLRPYSSAREAPRELLARVESILEAIAVENAGFFRAFARAVATGEFTLHDGSQATIGAPLRVHFLPGNHDRLANGWPAVRARIRGLLGIAGDPEAPFPHLLDFRAEYGVLVRHGHEYEPANFSARLEDGPPGEAAYAAPVLGDFATIDLVTRLPVAFRARFAKELRAPGPSGELHRHLYLALTEFDDVRPASALPVYLAGALGETAPAGFSILRPVLRDVFETARADPFFLAETRRLGLGKYVRGPLGELLDSAIRHLGPEWLPKILAATAAEPDPPEPPASQAAREATVKDGTAAVVIAGHTHKPANVAIPGGGSTSACFIDSGTWRTRIDEGVGGAFGRLRSYTMVFCYRDPELRGSERRRFETWTGHLSSDDYGAYARAAPPRASDVATVVFTELRVVAVDEGDTADGAELELRFGVDATELVYSSGGVKNGDVVPLDPRVFRVAADSALDGELWCWGVEKDRGEALVDPDDPLPWAIDFLAREAGGAAFRRTADVELLLANARGCRLRLVYRVE